MILFNVIRRLLAGRDPIRQERVSSILPAQFERDKKRPSILALTHSYSGNGAAEMFVFLLTWVVRDLGWQVNALATSLSDKDKAVLRSVNVGLVDVAHPDQYDFAIANTVVSGLSFVDQFHSYLPCVLWIHEAEFVIWNSQLPLSFWKRTISSATHLVFQSSWQAERIFGSFTSQLSPERYSVIPNCLPDFEIDKSTGSDKASNVKRIIFIGGVYERKRPADLVRAVLALGRFDVECLFIGTDKFVGDLPDDVKFSLNGDKRFKILGEIPRAETLQYLASSDVLSLPSADESQPLVLMEALALNVPVIISNLPVYSGIWTDGENCLMHSVGDIPGLTVALDNVLYKGWFNSGNRESGGISVGDFCLRFKDIFDGLLEC